MALPNGSLINSDAAGVNCILPCPETVYRGHCKKRD